MFNTAIEEILPSPFQKEILKEINDTVYCIEEIVDDGVEEYENFIETIRGYLRQGFECKQFREFPVKVKLHANDEKVYVFQLRHLLTNIIFWKPLVVLDLDDYLDEEYLIDCSKISSKFIKWYLDTHLIIPFRKEVSNKKLNLAISDMLYELNLIALDFNPIMGISISAETFMDLAERIPRFNEIIRTKLDPDNQPKDNEEILDKLQEEMVEIIKNDPVGNLLQPILKPGAGIKEKQLTEFACQGGYKPDLFGNTIPLPITSNFLIGGLGSIPNYYIDASAGRKAAIMNSTVMGKSGWFARKIMLITTDTKLRRDNKVCRSVNGVTYEIKTKEHLSRLKGRYYLERTGDKFKVLKGDETHLIGKKLLFKSPITCSSKEGICKECYGELFYSNSDLYSVGALAGAKATNPISQNVLSSKHLLTTISKFIEFNPEFYEFFKVVGNEIYLIGEDDNPKFKPKDYNLVIEKADINSVEDFDENDFNQFISKFYIKNNKTEEMIEIKELDNKMIYISPELDDIIKPKLRRVIGPRIEIPFTTISTDDSSFRLFTVIIENNELTAPLYAIMRALDSNTHNGATTIDELAQMLLDLFIESKINMDAVHIETIVKPLVRDTRDILKAPNFNIFQYNEPIPEGTPTKDKKKFRKDYQILGVSTALEKNPSVLVSLSFEDLGRQFVDPLTYRKQGSSFLDPFFKERLLG